jgi:hypothetical protein
VIRRWDALIGAAGFGLLFAALSLPGPPPKADDSTVRLTATLVEHRDAFVRGTVLAGLGVLGLLWFVAALTAALRDADAANARAAAAAAVGGVAAVVFMLSGMLVFSGVAFKAASMGDPVVVRAAVDTGNMIIESSKYAFAILILATCATTGIGALRSTAMRRAGRIAAVALVVSSVPPYLVDHGIGQFGGPIDVLGGVPAFVWLVALSVGLALTTAGAARPAAAVVGR